MGLRRYITVKRSEIEETLYDFHDLMMIYFTADRAKVSPLEYELRARLVDSAHKIIELLEA